MPSLSYHSRRNELETYFDRTAVEAWKRLTSEAPVGGIRATVRAGRNEMRDNLLSWLPQDLRAARVLDAGCGSGALAVELARRGAEVLAVDISPSLIEIACERAPKDVAPGRINWRVGDMLEPAFGRFDYVVAMDSFVHYDGPDVARVISGLAERTTEAILFTVAPRTFALTVMHAVGRFFPRSDRAPAIAPISARQLQRELQQYESFGDWHLTRTRRVARGFYISEAMEARRS